MLKSVRIAVDGMSCSSCERRIESAVRSLPGVVEARASASLREVSVTYDESQAHIEAACEAIRGAGYSVRDASSRGNPRAMSVYQFLGLAVVIVALFLIIRHTVGFSFIPTVSQSMGFGLILVVGLVTSVHCIAMCGGITLSQTVAREAAGDEGRIARRGCSRLLPAILYNGGRVASYTIVGGVVGALGSVFSLSATLQGLMPAVAGLFMLFIGVRMLGVFPWLSRLRIHIPMTATRLGRGKTARRGPLFVGLLNGLMPCGPLQTMQVYALGTGSFLNGALAMFLFSLGTVPLMFGFGAVSSYLSARFNRRMLKASAALVMVLGLVMFTRGLSLFGVPLQPGPSGTVAVAKIEGAVQTVRTDIEPGRYYPFVVQKGMPVRWIITAKKEDLNGCNNPITIPQYDIKARLVPGENLIQFTPDRDGTIAYTCWMGMISSTIRIVPDLAQLTARDLRPQDQAGASSPRSAAGGCCSGASLPRFADGRVPTDVIGLARLEGEGLVVDVRVNDEGYTPALIVLQRGGKVRIRFVPEQLNSCNSSVIFPEYQGGLDLQGGQTETPYLRVSQDFTFQCGMNMIRGYAKVVDDLASVDLDAVRREVSAYRAAAGGSCAR